MARHFAGPKTVGVALDLEPGLAGERPALTPAGAAVSVGLLVGLFISAVVGFFLVITAGWGVVDAAMGMLCTTAVVGGVVFLALLIALRPQGRDLRGKDEGKDEPCITA